MNQSREGEERRKAARILVDKDYSLFQTSHEDSTPKITSMNENGGDKMKPSCGNMSASVSQRSLSPSLVETLDDSSTSATTIATTRSSSSSGASHHHAADSSIIQEAEVGSLWPYSSNDPSRQHHHDNDDPPCWWDRMCGHAEKSDLHGILEQSILQANLAEETALRMQRVVCEEINGDDERGDFESSDRSSPSQTTMLLLQEHRDALDESELQASFAEQTAHEMDQVLQWWDKTSPRIPAASHCERQSHVLSQNSLVFRSPSSSICTSPSSSFCEDESSPSASDDEDKPCDASPTSVRSLFLCNQKQQSHHGCLKRKRRRQHHHSPSLQEALLMSSPTLLISSSTKTTDEVHDEARRQMSAVDALCTATRRMASLVNTWDEDCGAETTLEPRNLDATVFKECNDSLSLSISVRLYLCISLQWKRVKCFLVTKLAEHLPSDILIMWLWLETRHPDVLRLTCRIFWPLLMALLAAALFRIYYRNDASPLFAPGRLVRYEQFIVLEGDCWENDPQDESDLLQEALL